MAGLTKVAALAQTKAEGLKLSTTAGKNRLAELMAAPVFETMPSHRFNWDSIPKDGLLTVIQRMAREGLNPREAEDWSTVEYQSAYCSSSGTSEQKLDSLMKQFVS